jgi:hypothetical protein
MKKTPKNIDFKTLFEPKHGLFNLVSGKATKHTVGDNINVTKHYVGSMVRFDTLFCRDIESFLLF